jgi:tetratricopeptide (TPR) repeat protein
LVQGNPNREKYREDLGHSQWRLADVLAETDRRGAAIEVIRQALQTFEKAVQDFPGYPNLRQEQAFTHRTLGDLHEGLGQLDDTERHYRAASELYATLKTEVPGNWFYHAEEAYTTWMLAAKLEQAGRFDAAVAYYRQALTLHEQAMGGFPHRGDFRSRRDSVRKGLVSLLNDQGKKTEAETILDEQSRESRVQDPVK